MWITRPNAASTLSCIISDKVGCGKTVWMKSVLDQLGGLADGVALDQLGDLGADHVRAEQFAGLGVEHGLHEALDLAERDRLAVADRRELADLDLVARFLGRGLGQADARDLRPAIGAAGDVLRVGRVRVRVLVAELLRDRLGGGDALVAGLVREPRRRGDVADRPDAGRRWCGTSASVSIWPLVVFTPSASSPIFSVLGAIPTATMQWLKRCSADLPSLVLIFAATPLASALEALDAGAR